MIHSEQPAAIYDLTVLASVLARYNVRSFDAPTSTEILNTHDAVLEVMREASHKPPVSHTDPEALTGARNFAAYTRDLLRYGEAKQRIDASRISETERVLDDYESDLASLNGTPVWLHAAADIDSMFGLGVTSDTSIEAMKSEIRQWSTYSRFESLDALQQPVQEDEVRRLSYVVRSEMFQVTECTPDVYCESDPRQHHLFWTSTANGQECAVPSDYSMETYLRFHCPHNDIHLAHLHALSDKGVESYTDFMDERAFFEAIAVQSEWQMYTEALSSREVGHLLHDQFSPERQKQISAEELNAWIIQSRGYEFRLRLARLVADILTIKDHLPFEAMVEELVNVTGLSHEDAEDEARKYYFLPGLGAVYSLGYLRLRNDGIKNTKDAYKDSGEVIRTWNQYQQQHEK